jgi:hypothetical protein
VVCRNFFPLQTANVTYSLRKIQLARFSAYPDGSKSQLICIIGVILHFFNVAKEDSVKRADMWQHLRVQICTTWPTRRYVEWGGGGNYIWSTPLYYTALFWSSPTLYEKSKGYNKGTHIEISHSFQQFCLFSHTDVITHKPLKPMPYPKVTVTIKSTKLVDFICFCYHISK